MTLLSFSLTLCLPCTNIDQATGIIHITIEFSGTLQVADADQLVANYNYIAFEGSFKRDAGTHHPHKQIHKECNLKTSLHDVDHSML